jgi:RNA polymerase sigma factor (sigma-70 family)
MTPVAESGDAELVNASLEGNREAFGQIVSRYQSLVCSLAYSATGSLSQSEDFAQETFLAAWKHLAELREPAKLRAWLCGIARNLINNSLRKQVREPSHRAAPLDEIQESLSPEPLPVERAISQEEAQILWRSLERIPETYRMPLVLFYREHQSIEAVAQNLELTQEAVRQRLSRGRKLLHEEVLAFVEVALEKTSPGKAFTMAVVAALPFGVTSAKAASVGVAVAKGGAGAKSLISLGALSALGGLASILGANLFSWKTMVDDSKSPGERKFVVRMARYQVLFFVFSLGASLVLVPTLLHKPWLLTPAFALLILALIANAVLVMPYIVRKRVEIQMREGSLLPEMEAAARTSIDRAFRQQSGSTEEAVLPQTMQGRRTEATRPDATRRTIKLTIPFLIMFVGVAIALPWKQNWLRSAAVIVADALLILWFFRRMLRLQSGQIQLRSPRGPAFMRNPFIKTSAILFATVLFAGLGGCLLPFFLNPGAAKSGIPWQQLRPLGLALLFAALAFAALVTLFVKVVPHWKWLAGKLDVPFLQHLKTVTQGPDAVAEITYSPLFQQLNLGPDQRAQLKDLVLKRTMVGVRAGMSLMNRKLDAAKRTALARDCKSETDALNEQIKKFLGGEQYAAFQQFEKTIPDRRMLDLLNRRSTKTAAALSPEQQERLLEALTKARGEHPWTTELSRRNQDAGDYPPLLTEDILNTFAREEEQFDRQFLSQAQYLLNPEQLAAFETLQARQRQSQIAQFKMAAKLFAPKPW